MIGEVTGNSIEKNRDGTKNVRLLQVKISDDQDIQTAELYSPAGDDSCPPDGSLVKIIDLGNNWKIAVAVNDGIEPESDKGEKILYSSSNGAKKAIHKFGTDEVHTFNGGAKDAARKDDQIQSTITEDGTFWAWVTTISAAVNALAPGSVPTVPTSLTGKITQGTDKIKLP